MIVVSETVPARWIHQGSAYGRPMSEAVLEPDLPICDAHHHLWLARGNAAPYTLDDLRADTGTGHNVVRTVFVECHSQYRTDGPAELRPVGEVELVAAVAERPTGAATARRSPASSATPT